MPADSPPLSVIEFASPITARAGRFLALQGHSVTRVSPADDDGIVDTIPWHLGKATVALTDADIESPDLRRALECADTVLIGDQRGDTPERLHATFPQLDVVCLTPWGRFGPRHAWLATDHTVAAAGGWTGQVGFPDDAPVTPPAEQAWSLTGLVGAIAAQIGAIKRMRTGTGELFDVAAVEVVAAALETGALAWLHEQRVVARPGRDHPLVMHQLVRAQDGWIAAGLGGNESMWQRLREWVAEEGEPGLLADRFDDPERRVEQRSAIFDVLARFCRTRSRSMLWESAQSRRLPWAAVLEPSEVAESAHLTAREFFRIERTDQYGAVLAPGLPVRLTVNAASPPGPRRPSDPRHQVALAAGDGVTATQNAAASLDGIRVLDLTWVLAGPFATRVLADHGADVIKVESVHRPDPTRWSSTMHLGPGPAGDPETSGYFGNHNRNKRSISLNLKDPAGLDVLRRLIGSVDVVVDNYSAGTLAKWGLDRTSLWSLQPDLVIAELSGMGQRGPWSHFVTYADAVSALSGLTAATVNKSGDVVGVVFGLADLIAGYHGAFAIVSALRARMQSGRGAYLDLSQHEAVACNLGPMLVRRSDGLPLEPPAPSTADHIMRCDGDDAWCAVSLPVDAVERAGRLAAIDAGDGVSTTADGPRDERWLVDFAVRSGADDFVNALQRAGLPAAVVADGRRLVEGDPQLSARGFYQPVDHPRAGRYLVEGDPILVGGQRLPIRDHAPLIGQHTRAVLTEIAGYTVAEVDELVAAGVTE